MWWGETWPLHCPQGRAGQEVRGGQLEEWYLGYWNNCFFVFFFQSERMFGFHFSQIFILTLKF